MAIFGSYLLSTVVVVVNNNQKNVGIWDLRCFSQFQIKNGIFSIYKIRLIVNFLLTNAKFLGIINFMSIRPGHVLALLVRWRAGSAVGHKNTIHFLEKNSLPHNKMIGKISWYPSKKVPPPKKKKLALFQHKKCKCKNYATNQKNHYHCPHVCNYVGRWPTLVL